MPAELLDSLFNALNNGNRSEIERIRSEKLLPKKLGLKEVPKDLKTLEAYVGNRLLSIAIENNDKAKVKKLLSHQLFSSRRKYNISIENVGRLKVTPLMHAVQKGNMGIVKLLIEEGADINAQIDSGPTPLILAAQMGKTDIAKYLIEKGAMLGLSDKQEKNAIMWAAQSNQAEMVKALMEKGANPLNPDMEGMTPLKYAVRNKASDSVEALLKGIRKSHGTKLMAQEREMALIYACKQGNTEMVKFLVSNGANLHHTFEDLKTPLAAAVECGKVDMVYYLLENGARPSRMDLEKSLFNPNVDHDDGTKIFKALISHGADPRSEEGIGDTFLPLIGNITNRAVLFHNSEALDVLFKDYNFDPNEQNGTLGSYLDLACSYNSERLGDTVKVLLNNGADPSITNPLTNQTAFETLLSRYPSGSLELDKNIKNAIGAFIDYTKEKKLESSLLMDAAKSAIKAGKVASIEAMIDKGMEVNQQDVGGNTMLKAAFEEASPEIVNALLKKGARPDIKNALGNSVIDRAKEVLIAQTNEHSKSAEMIFDSLEYKKVRQNVDSRLARKNSWKQKILNERQNQQNHIRQKG